MLLAAVWVNPANSASHAHSDFFEAAASMLSTLSCVLSFQPPRPDIKDEPDLQSQRSLDRHITQSGWCLDQAVLCQMW